MRTSNFLASLLILSSLLPPAWSYDEVKLEKIVPLVDRKSSPSIMHMDSARNLWVLNDQNQAIQQIGLDGKVAINFLPGKKESNFFKEPIDFGFLSNGSMVVADKGFDRIVTIGVESAEGKPSKIDWKKAKVVGQFPAKGVSALAVSHDDILAVGFDGQASVEIYSDDGILLHRLFAPEKAPFKNVISMAYAANGVLWVLDGEKSTLQRFSSDRRNLGAVEGLENARAVTVDSRGYAYVSITKGKWAEVSPDGVITGRFGAKGKNPGEMLNPIGIAAPDPEHVWVAEGGNNRIQSFRILNRSKTALLFPEPAAYIQARFLSGWEDHVDAGVVRPNGDLLLFKADKTSFEVSDMSGNSKAAWKKKGKGSAGFARPHSLFVDPDGKTWISDQGEHTIKLVNDAGDIQKFIGQKGKKEGSFQSPSFFSIRKDGSFVVVDRDNSRVQVLSAQGLFLFSPASPVKKDGSFDTIGGVATNDDFIVVLDSGRKSLLFYNASGKLVNEIANKEGKAPYWTEPVSIAADKDGRFFVLDDGARRVRIFGSKGQFLADFSANGHRLVCGPDHKVLVLGEKEVRVYSATIVPKLLTNVNAADAEGDVQVTWDLSPEAKDYNVYRSSGTNAPVVLAKVDNPPYTDSTVVPNVLYTYAITGVNDMGYEGNWSAAKPIKASRRKDVSIISFDHIRFDPIFTAAFKYYVTNPIGEITIQNNDDRPYRNVKLSLTLARYTDFPTEVVVSELGGGEKKTVPVTMTFNDKVLELTEDTPVQMDVQLSYYEDNQEKSVSQTSPITLYSRNAISWTDRARIASFVTPRDTPVVEFARDAIRAHMAILKASTVTKPLAKAALFYESMNALGISYVPDPKTPFSEVSGKPDTRDYVQFPRETLRRKTGDCDDTTALLAALLESVGVQVALVDVPGHIFLMANLEEADPAVIGLPEERFVKYQGTYWVPIETTQLGHGFMAAWQTATSEVKTAQEKNQATFISILDSNLKYPPVTLVEPATEIPPFPAEKVAAAFPALLAQLQNERYLAQMKDVKERIKNDPVNHMLAVEMGMIQVEGGKADDAKKTFIDLLKPDEPIPVQAAARNNLGNLAYLAGEYKEAAIHYDKALELTPNDGGILVNKARIAWKMDDKAGAQKLLQEAQAVLPEWRDFATDIPAEFLPK